MGVAEEEGLAGAAKAASASSIEVSQRASEDERGVGVPGVGSTLAAELLRLVGSFEVEQGHREPTRPGATRSSAPASPLP